MEQAMSSQNNDFDQETEADIDELSRHGMALHQLVQDYTSVKMHMVGYALETEKPSASGLKLHLDRFRREMDHLIRDAKKNADQFIAQAKTLRAAAENESADKLDDDRGLPS
jgi:hypothetical protein